MLIFPLHFPLRHVNCEVMYCNICDGGLFFCTRCNSAEGATTTHCPGDYMTPDQIDKVYEGVLDYDYNLGWINRTSKYSPKYRKPPLTSE